MQPLRATLAALLLLAAADMANAGSLEDALAASKKSDYATALRLFRPLAEKGNVVAQSALGFMYETSEGVPQDYAEAAKWYHLAAAQGDAFAQTRLGYMNEIGVGVPRDFAAAAKLFRLAAEQGRAVAQNELGDMYSSGRGVPQDYVAAYMWLSLAAAQDDHAAALRRDRIAKLMTPAQIEQAQKLAREWKPKSGP